MLHTSKNSYDASTIKLVAAACGKNVKVVEDLSSFVNSKSIGTAVSVAFELGSGSLLLEPRSIAIAVADTTLLDIKIDDIKSLHVRSFFEVADTQVRSAVKSGDLTAINNAVSSLEGRLSSYSPNANPFVDAYVFGTLLPVFGSSGSLESSSSSIKAWFDNTKKQDWVKANTVQTAKDFSFEVQVAKPVVAEAKKEEKKVAVVEKKTVAAAESKKSVADAAVKKGPTAPQAFVASGNAELDAAALAVKELKAKKAPKAEIDAAVAKLLALKSAAGSSAAPVADAAVKKGPTAPQAFVASGNAELDAAALAVKELKANKAPKAEIDAAVAKLLALKAAAGVGAPVSKPAVSSSSATSASNTSTSSTNAAAGAKKGPTPPSGAHLTGNPLIDEAANAVRELKASGAPKEQIDAAVARLVAAKGGKKKENKKHTNTKNKEKKNQKEVHKFFYTKKTFA
jgi:hypothetical protein